MPRIPHHDAERPETTDAGFVNRLADPVAEFFVKHGYKPAEEAVLDFLRKRYPDAEKRAEEYAVAQAVVPYSKYGTDIRVVPNSSPALVLNRPTRPDGGLAAFDPKKADAEYVPDVWEGVDIGRTRITPKGGLGQLAIPESPDVMHRGMSHEELLDALSNGGFQSKGEWNLPGQEGLTFFSSRPSQAESYASGFAPWQFKPTFDRPAWIASVARRPENIGQVVGETELGINGKVPLSDLLSLHRGDPYAMSGAQWNLVDDWGSKHLSGSAMDSRVSWSPYDLDNLLLAR